MELFNALPAALDHGAPLPGSWTAEPVLACHETLGDLAAVIGRFDGKSDDVIAALLTMPLDDELVTPVLLAGLRRLLFLCRGSRRELLDDLIVESAIAIAELRRVRPLTFRRRLAYVIVDRARDRQRASLRRDRSWLPIDALSIGEVLPTRTSDVEDDVLDRVRLGVVREQVVASGDSGLRRSWNSLIELVDTPRSSQAERDRWKYIRRRLSDYLDPDAA
jgi:hypothetical protein